MRKRLSLFAALIAITATAPASAEMISRCVIEVHGISYLDGPCNYDAFDKDGSFSIGTTDDDKPPSKYFAFVHLQMDPAGPTAFWNDEHAEGHAHDPLGIVTRKGACWINAIARVCAFR